MVASIVIRELGVPITAVIQTKPLNQKPWVINSAFSNQRLWAFVAKIDPKCCLPEDRVGFRVSATEDGVRRLLEILDCLQCRSVLMEWARRETKICAGY